jgi:DeoR/GlpR family transcriptional regulator of sugar metabolism
VRVRDLAQITGRPRETIRRKLERMEAAGRVKRVVNGWVLDVAAVDPQMQALTMDGVRRLMKTAETITAVLDDTRQTLRAEQSGPNNSPMACGPG